MTPAQKLRRVRHRAAAPLAIVSGVAGLGVVAVWAQLSFANAEHILVGTAFAITGWVGVWVARTTMETRDIVQKIHGEVFHVDYGLSAVWRELRDLRNTIR